MDRDEDEWFPDVEPVETRPALRFCLSALAWALLLVFTSGVGGLCVRMFHFAAWD